MNQNGRPRRRFEASSAPSSLHEITRRYVATALALSKAMGLPLTEAFLQTYHPAISTCFIESSKVGVRLPERVRLPPLGELDAGTNVPADPREAAPIADGTGTNVPPKDPLPPEEGDAPISSPNGESPAGDVPAVPPPPNGDAPLPTCIPREGDWPCAGQEIRHLKPAQLHLLVSRAGFRAHTDTAVMPLLAALQVERAKRLEAGRRPKLVAVEGDGHGA